jgi:O-antigen/teichoic acid export membrane protein
MKSGSLVINSLFNLVGLVTPLMVSLFYIPVMIAAMGSSRYGLYSLVMVIFSYLGFLEFGIGRAASKYVSDGSMQGREGAIVSQSIMLTGGFGLVGGLMAAAASPWIAGFFGGSAPDMRQEFLYALLMLAVIVPVMLLESVFRCLLEARNEFFYLNIIRIVVAVAAAVLTFVAARHGYSAIHVFFLLQVLLRILSLLVHALLWQRRVDIRLTLSWQPDVVKLLLVFGGWSSVSALIGPIMVNLDRFWVAYHFSPEQVAFYTVPFDVITKLWMIPAALVTVLFPGLARLGLENSVRVDQLVREASLLVALLLLPAVIVAVFFGDILMTWWIGSGFAGRSAIILMVMAIGVLVNSPAQVVYVALQAVGRPRIPALFHLLEVPLYLLALVLLSVKYGLPGVAWAWVLRAALDSLLLGSAFSVIVSGNYRLVRDLLLIIGLGLLLLLPKYCLSPPWAARVGVVLFLATSVWVLVKVWEKYTQERRGSPGH